MRLWHSGKFWLKTGCYGILAAAVLVIAAQILLQHLFDADKIRRTAEAALAGSGRHIRFADDIGRSWFPRPTFTLSQVRIGSSGRHQDDISVARMHIGLGWQSLFGSPVVEKWVWEDADLRLYPQGMGWNTDDLVRLHGQNGGSLPVNRFYVRDSRIDLTDRHGHRHHIRDLNFYVRGLQNDESPFEGSVRWQRQDWPEVTAVLSGTRTGADAQQHRYKLKLETEADWPLLGPTRSVWQGHGVWQAGALLLQQVQWQSHSDTLKLDTNGSGQGWRIGAESADIPQASLLLDAAADNGRSGSATLVLNRLRWQRDTAALDHFQFNGSWQTPENQTLFNAAGGFSLLADGSWRADPLRIGSHHDALTQAANPRFVSELSGSLSGQLGSHAQWSLGGKFDNQPVSLEIAYSKGEPHNLSVRLELAEWSLRPYWPQQAARPDADWVAAQWRRWLSGWDTLWHIDIGRVITPWGEMGGLKVRARADADEMTLEHTIAELYAGHSSGRISARNNDSREWSWSQQFHGIDIKPLLQDAFQFNNLEGSGQAGFNLRGRDWLQDAWLNRLNGQATLQLQAGRFRGIDINNVLQSGQGGGATLDFNEQSHTPFTQLSMSVPIAEGIGTIRQSYLNAEQFHIDGAGSLDFMHQHIDYNVLIHTRNRHNNGQNILPLKISGPMTRPGFTLDYQRLTSGLATPEQKEQALRQTIRRQWQWLNQGRAASAPAASAP